MEGLPPGILILMVAALSAFAGALLTWIVVYVSGRGSRKTGQHTSQDEEAPTDDLLRVVRTKSDPAIFVQGRRLHHLREIEDRETGQETVAAIKAVLAFAEGWLPTLQEKQAPSGSANGRAAMGGLGASRLQRSNLVTPKRAHGTSSSESLKLVEEIDALIQKRLEDRPDLARRGVRLTRDVHGHPLIYVGQERYRSAGEIPDDEVSAFVRETIQVWENQ